MLGFNSAQVVLAKRRYRFTGQRGGALFEVADHRFNTACTVIGIFQKRLKHLSTPGACKMSFM